MAQEEVQSPKDKDETSQMIPDELLEQVTGGASSTPSAGFVDDSSLPSARPLAFGGEDWDRKKL